jgi:hypothetical protein
MPSGGEEPSPELQPTASDERTTDLPTILRNLRTESRLPASASHLDTLAPDSRPAIASQWNLTQVTDTEASAALTGLDVRGLFSKWVRAVRDLSYAQVRRPL